MLEGGKKKIVLNAVVSVFLGVNKDGQPQRIGHEFQSESQKRCYKTLMIFIMKSDIDKRFYQDGSVAFFRLQ